MDIKKRYILRVLGLTGVFGGLICVLADVMSGYSPESEGMRTALSVTLDQVQKLLLNKTHTELLLGHYLAYFGIPLVGVTIIPQTYIALKPAGTLLSKCFLVLGLYVFSMGTAFHITFGFMAEALQLGNKGLVDSFKDFFEPMGFVLLGLAILLLILWEILLRSGRSLYSRRMLFFSPITVVIATLVLTELLPQSLNSLRVLLVVTGLNLPVLVWSIASTTDLWNLKD
ncbi:hypothetical protein OAT67_02215 [Bacteriovoracaceae bacterium]|nr:hypothetical protein [Bacteriovoracaceae bacterium]